MMKALLNNQRKIVVNTIKSQSLKNYIGYLVSFGFLFILLYFLSKGVWEVSPTITKPVLAGILSYGFLMVIGFIVLLGLPQVFKQLYATTDLELLFTMPIPTRHIFWMKYMQSFVGIPLLGFLFFVVPLFIYGIGTGASLLFYPIVVLVLLAVAVMGLSIAYLFNLVLIQLVPASRANEFMTVMSLLSGLFVYLMLTIPNMANDQSLSEMLLSGLPLFPDWVPVSWGSAALIHASGGSLEFFLPFILIVLLAIVSVILTSSFVEKGFRTGWIRLSEGTTKKKNRKKSGVRQKLHHPIIAVGKKEWFAIKRDLREWLVFMPLAIFIIFPLIGFFSGGGNLSELRGHNEISWPIAQGMLLFLYAILNGMIAASSIGREGASVWILRTLPLPGKYIALGKLWISWLMPFILLTTFECIVGVFLGWTTIQFISGMAMKAVITIGISAIGLWLGTLGAKYHPTNPQARLKFGTSIIQLVISYLYLFIALIPFAFLIFPMEAVELPTNINHGITGFGGVIATVAIKLITWQASNPVLMKCIWILVMLLVSLGIAILFTFISARRMDKGIEIEIVNESNAKPLFGSRKPGGKLY